MDLLIRSILNNDNNKYLFCIFLYVSYNKKLIATAEKTTDIPVETKSLQYNLKKNKYVTYSSQGDHTGQLDSYTWLAEDRIMWLALRSIKSNNVDFLNQIRYFSIK